MKILSKVKKVAFFCTLFIAVFAFSYYVVNMLELKPAPKAAPLQTVTTMDLKADDEQLKQRIGSGDIGLANFKQWMKANDLTGSDVYDADPDKDNLANYLEYLHGTDPNNADTDGDGFSDGQEIKNGYDPDAPGEAKPLVEVSIAKLKVDVPMVWSKSEKEKDMLADLENGISHFYKTAAPGQNGNAIISGHSSNYIWAKGNYNYIFKNLNNLEKGDVVTVKTMQKNGKVFVYNYKVNDKFITTPDDSRVFAETPTPTMTLSTCWPIGTNLKRVIVKLSLES